MNLSSYFRGFPAALIFLSPLTQAQSVPLPAQPAHSGEEEFGIHTLQMIPSTTGDGIVSFHHCAQFIDHGLNNAGCSMSVTLAGGLRSISGTLYFIDTRGNRFERQVGAINDPGWEEGEVVTVDTDVLSLTAQSEGKTRGKRRAVPLNMPLVSAGFLISDYFDGHGRGHRIGPIPKPKKNVRGGSVTGSMTNDFRLGQLDESIPKGMREFLEQADHLEIILLGNGQRDAAPKDGADWVDAGEEGWYSVGAKVPVDKPADRQRLLKSFFRGAGEANGAMACWGPAHALRAHKDGKRLDLVICFRCQQFNGNGPAGPIHGVIYDSPCNTFNAMLKAGGVNSQTCP